MFFLWSLSNSKYPNLSRTLLSILADFNSSVLDGVDSSSNIQFIESLF